MRQAPITRRRHHHVPAPRLSEAPPARHGSEISTGLPSSREQRRLSRPAPLPEHTKVDFAYLYSRHQHLLHARRLHRGAQVLYAQGKHKEAMELSAQALAIAHPSRAYRTPHQPSTFDKIVSGTVGRHGLLGAGEDLVRSANPVSLVETLSARAQHPLRRDRTGISAGVIMPGFGRFGAAATENLITREELAQVLDRAAAHHHLKADRLSARAAAMPEPSGLGRAWQAQPYHIKENRLSLQYASKAVRKEAEAHSHLAGALRAGRLSVHDVLTSPQGDVLFGTGLAGFGIPARAARRVATPARPRGPDLFGKETITRPRTRAEAETRLRQLDRQLEGLYRRVGKGIGHPLAEPDIAQQIGRSRSLLGRRARGKAVEGRVTGPPVTRPSVKAELRTAAIDTIERFAKRNPEHPVFKAWQAAETEREALMRSLHGHMPGETPSGELGTVSEERFAPGEEVRRSLGAMRTARAEQKRLASAERGVRVGRGEAAMEEAGGGVAGFKAAMAEQRGELPKVTFDRLREGTLGTADVERLVRHVQAHPELEFWQRQNATRAILDAVEHGRTPTPSEIKLLQTAFGHEAATALAKLTPLKKLGRFAVELETVPRALMATADVSFGGRQALVAGVMHPRIWGRTWPKSLRSFGSEAYFRKLVKDVEADPNYELATEAGVKFTSGESGTGLAGREEQHMSQLPERVPVFGRVVRSSNRAYVAFGNKMRMDMFNRQLLLARRKGVNVEEPKNLKGIANLVNNATGRGTLGPLESWAPALNFGFFAPRLVASRVNMVANPIWYMRQPRFVRVQALKGIIGLAGAGSSVLGLAYILGAKTNLDPTNADFAKVRVGDTRGDPWGGFQQYIRLASQLVEGKVTSSTTGKTLTLGRGFGDLNRQDIIRRFAESKLNPPVSVVNDFFKGTTFAGQPFEWKRAVIQRMVPLVAQDTYQVYRDKRSVPTAALVYAIAAFGIGMQTYGPKKPKGGGSLARPRSRSLLGPRTSGGGSSLLRRGGSSGGGQSLLRR